MDREMYLVLENGEVFKGKSFGAEAGGADMGEVVFQLTIKGTDILGNGICRMAVQNHGVPPGIGLAIIHIHSCSTFLRNFLAEQSGSQQEQHHQNRQRHR